MTKKITDGFTTVRDFLTLSTIPKDKIMAKKNRLLDLQDHLFEQLERLNDDDLKGEALETEITRSKAISEIAKNLTGNARIVLDAHIAAWEWGKTPKDVHGLLE